MYDIAFRLDHEQNAFKNANLLTRFVDFNRGQTEARVRLQSGSAKAAADTLNASESGLVLGGSRVNVRALNETEAREYQAQVQAKVKGRGGKGKKGGRGGGKRGGKGGGRGAKGAGAGSERANKKAKTAASASSSSSSAAS